MIPYAKENTDDLCDKEVVYEVDKSGNKVKWRDWILLNRPLKVFIILLLTTVLAPILIYHYLFATSLELPPSDGLSFGSCLIPRQSRLPCGYGNITNISERHRECCYDPTNRFCFHRFPSRFSYVLRQEWSEGLSLSPRISKVPYGFQRSLDPIKISADEVSATHLSLTFYKSDEQLNGRRLEEKNYVYNISGPELNIFVNSSHGNIFNTARGPLIASNDIWEITFKITNETMFGLGEIPLKENTVKVIYNHKGGMSSVPLIFAKSNGAYHGLLIDTIAPTEISIRSESQMIVRSITNWGLKFHLFVGPKPADIMRDVMILTGAEKKLEYWMLGAHICSENSTVQDLRTYLTNASNHNMPFESHCGTAPAYFHSDCNNTHITLVNEGATVLKNAGKKFVPHVSPYIKYTAPYVPSTESTTEITTEGTTEGALVDTQNITTITRMSNETDRCFDDEAFGQFIIRDPNAEQYYIGIIDEQEVIYPMYNIVNEEFMEQLWVYENFDGVILENSWPLDQSEKSVKETHLFLPYYNENFEKPFKYTPQWNATRPERYLYTHNKYGNQFAEAFVKVNNATPILSTSQWMNGNVGINRQDIETSWASLQRELIEMSLGGISGHWYWSSPVCGDTENFNNRTQIRLCAKWYMASTYFPMIKIYSKEVMRDPLAFIGTDRAQMITALRTRMTMLPYFYSVLQEGPLLRPMFYQFPFTDELANVTTQFSVGDGLMIVPNLEPGQTHVHIFMPPGQWYEFGSGLKLEGDVGQAVTMTTTEADLLKLIHGGSIIVMQTHLESTIAVTQLKSPYTIIIALHCETRNITDESETTTQVSNYTSTASTSDEAMLGTDTPGTTDLTTTTVPMITTCSAKGKFHMSSNMTILFESDAYALKITAEGGDFEIFCNELDATWAKKVWYIKVYGLDEEKNNYDHHFNKDVLIDLCNLQANDKIIDPYF